MASRTLRHWYVVLMVVLGAGTSLGAPLPPAEGARPRVVVFDIPPQKSFASLGILNAFFDKDLRDQGFAVMSQAEVQATLGVDKANQLSACTDPGCDSELAVALKADFVARGAVVVAGPSTTLALSLEDLTGKSISRAEAAVVGKATDDSPLEDERDGAPAGATRSRFGAMAGAGCGSRLRRVRSVQTGAIGPRPDSQLWARGTRRRRPRCRGRGVFVLSRSISPA